MTHSSQVTAVLCLIKGKYFEFTRPLFIFFYLRFNKEFVRLVAETKSFFLDQFQGYPCNGDINTKKKKKQLKKQTEPLQHRGRNFATINVEAHKNL